MKAAERWPSAAARDQHPSWAKKNYLREMLSRRQLQGFVGLRVGLATQIEQHPTFGCTNPSDADYADTKFFAAGNYIIAPIRRLKFA